MKIQCDPRFLGLALFFGSIAVLIFCLAPAPQTPAEAGNLKALAEARARVARLVTDYYVDRRLAPPGVRAEAEAIPAGEQVEVWSRRLVDARLDASTNHDERSAILLEDFERTKAIEARVKDLAENDRGPTKIDVYKAEFYRLDAEYRFSKEKAGR